MTSHPHINEIEKLMVVRMNSRGYTMKDIACVTGYGSSTLYRILANHRDTGDVVTRNLPVGCKRKLSATGVQVYACQMPALQHSLLIFQQFLLDHVARTPDVELDELATALREDSGVVVSVPTIHRELALYIYVDCKCTGVVVDNVSREGRV